MFLTGLRPESPCAVKKAEYRNLVLFYRIIITPVLQKHDFSVKFYKSLAGLAPQHDSQMFRPDDIAINNCELLMLYLERNYLFKFYYSCHNAVTYPWYSSRALYIPALFYNCVEQTSHNTRSDDSTFWLLISEEYLEKGDRSVGKRLRKKQSKVMRSGIEHHLSNQIAKLLLFAIVITGLLSMVIGRR
jgi:hypothetical protein